MKICDLTQFYSPLSGGVKRYVHEKIAYISSCSPDDTHVLIIPGSKSEVTTNGRSRIYSIRSPLVSRSSRYRALLNLRSIEEILERERPDLIESSDPYQIGWKAIAAGRALRVPVVGFYHSHFPEAYLRGGTKFLGKRGTQRAMKLTRAYVRRLYNCFQATLVPSESLADLLSEWGVRNVRSVRLGVNTGIFKPVPEDGAATRHSLGVGRGQTLLLYAGRLAREKNTQTLFRAFELLCQRDGNKFHLLVIGDGPQRSKVQKLQRRTGNVSWVSYCADSVDLARSFRSSRRSRNVWTCGLGKSGMRHTSSGNSRELHGSDYLSRPEIVGAREQPGSAGRCDRKFQREKIVSFGEGRRGGNGKAL